jgi:hypothetical protein
MHIVVNEELKAYIDPLTPDEREALERSILAEGCRDALVLWGDVLVDGHNRYGICKEHGLPFQTVQNTRFQSIEDVHLWMIDQHLGRRSVSDFQRGVLALRKRDIVAARRAQREAAPADASTASAEEPPAEALDTREALAKAARISNSQAVMIEKIHQHAAPEVVAAVRAGDISINAAAAVASLPAEEQVAAAAAGTGELKQAAKRVREAGKKKPAVDADGEAAPKDNGEDTVESLRARVAELTAENKALKKQVMHLLGQRPGASAPAPAESATAQDDAPF